MTINFIANQIAADMVVVDRIIHQCLHSKVELIGKISEHIIHSGGKRLRPMVLVLCAKALGYQGRDHHKLAAVIELTHTATLLHDDVVDESTLRRGLKSANAEFGNAASVLVGDFLYSRAFHTMLETNDMHAMPVLRVLSGASNLIAEGEVLQLMNCHNADISEEAYQQVIDYKTAKLFEAATRIGAIVADATSQMEQSLADYGKHLGLAFQLVDDALDYSGDEREIGKNLGDDLAEGKTTLPLIYAMQHGSAEQSLTIRHAIENGGRDDFPSVLAAIHATGALHYTISRAKAQADLAIQAISALPASEYKNSLLQLPSFAVERSF